MRTTSTSLAAIGLVASRTLAVPAGVYERYWNNASIKCPSIPSPGSLPTYQQQPDQSAMPDPFLYLKYTTTDNACSSSSFAQDVMTGKGQHRVATPDEWYKCRQPELLQLLQRYQYGYYPDHSQEKVEATRSGNTVQISVTAGGKTGRFKATIALPSGASKDKPAPVVINIGGMQNAPYISAGIAVAQFDYTSVAADSNSNTGAFWDMYKGKNIGKRPYCMGLGFPPDSRRSQYDRSEINANKVGVTGCSRLGKGALAAGLFDTRITVTMPMSSCVQGAGPYRYHTISGQDETLENSKAGASWWSDSTLGKFVNYATNLLHDAHTIVAALAPRAVMIDQGTGDSFTNSKATAMIVYPAAKLMYDWLGASDQIAMSVRSGAYCDMSGYTAVLPYVQKIRPDTPTTKDYSNRGTYGSPITTAYPWNTAVPKNA